MISNESIRSIFVITTLTIFLAIACRSRPAGSFETEKTNALPTGFQKEKEPQPVFLPAQRIESAGRKAKAAKIPSSDPLTGETPGDHALNKTVWGREATPDEIIAMAKSGEIQQIEWHVMPNIIRVQALDSRIFHIRNENRGIDMRDMLIHAGVQVGEGGISFRHVF